MKEGRRGSEQRPADRGGVTINEREGKRRKGRLTSGLTFLYWRSVDGEVGGKRVNERRDARRRCGREQEGTERRAGRTESVLPNLVRAIV